MIILILVTHHLHLQITAEINNPPLTNPKVPGRIFSMKNLIVVWLFIFLGTVARAEHKNVVSYEIDMVDPSDISRVFKVNFNTKTNPDAVDSFEKIFWPRKVDDNGRPLTGIINGPIYRVIPGVEHPWNFQFIPSGFVFAEMTTEVCDGNLTETDKMPSETLDAHPNFCPWTTSAMTVVIKQNGVVVWSRKPTP